jgi:hypothetical protein
VPTAAIVALQIRDLQLAVYNGFVPSAFSKAKPFCTFVKAASVIEIHLHRSPIVKYPCHASMLINVCANCMALPKYFGAACA